MIDRAKIFRTNESFGGGKICKEGENALSYVNTVIFDDARPKGGSGKKKGIYNPPLGRPKISHE